MTDLTAAVERLQKAKVHRGYRYRLYPTPEQEATLRQWCGAVRAVYNVALEQRSTYYRQYERVTGRRLTWVAQSAEMKDLRAAFEWIAAVPTDALTAALRDLDAAYAAFFAGRAKYPDWRRAGENDSFRVRGINAAASVLNAEWGAVRVPKLGRVKYRAHRPIPPGVIGGVTVSRRSGRWWVAFSWQGEIATPPAVTGCVGIDRGIAQTLTLSNGEVFQAPDTTRLEALRRRAQKALSRRKKGSGRYRVQRERVGRLSARIAAARTDWCHRTSVNIARRFSVVAVEDLRISNMTASARGTAAEPGRGVSQKAGLNRSILEQSWGRFAAFLDYKLAERGGDLITVPAAYTSQTCAVCGVIDAKSRESQARFICVACGHTDNADVNAAKEILRRSTPGLDVEAGVSWPVKRQPVGAPPLKPDSPGMLFQRQGETGMQSGASNVQR
jgi:putative transposase